MNRNYRLRRYRDEDNQGYRFAISQYDILYGIGKNKELYYDDEMGAYVSKEVFRTENMASRKAKVVFEEEKRKALEKYLNYNKIKKEVTIPYGEFGEDEDGGFAFYENGKLARRSEKGYTYKSVSMPDPDMGEWELEVEINITSSTTFDTFFRAVKKAIEREFEEVIIEVVEA